MTKKTVAAAAAFLSMAWALDASAASTTSRAPRPVNVITCVRDYNACLSHAPAGKPSKESLAENGARLARFLAAAAKEGAKRACKTELRACSARVQ